MKAAFSYKKYLAELVSFFQKVHVISMKNVYNSVRHE